MTKLYIIGNGFDIHHGLPTEYKNFHQFILREHIVLEPFFGEYYEMNTNKEGLWSDFENDLGTFNPKLFFSDNNHLNIDNDDFRPNRAFCLEDDIVQETDSIVGEIQEAFENWLNQIHFENICKKFDFGCDSVFLNFNYTLTLEEVYKIPAEKITHIHGDVETNQDSLIFGHNRELKTESEIDENGDSNRTMFTDSENVSKYPFYAFQKPVKEIINANKRFFVSLKDIEEVIVIGHSLNSVDRQYFQEVLGQLKDKTKWKVSFFKEKENESHLKTLQEIGIKETNIELFKME